MSRLSRCVLDPQLVISSVWKCLLGIVVLAASVAEGWSACPNQLVVSPDRMVVSPIDDDVLIVQLLVDNTADAYGIQVDLNYDPTYLTLTNAVLGDYFDSSGDLVEAALPGTYPDNSGIWKGAVSQTEALTAVPKQGVFATLTFQVALVQTPPGGTPISGTVTMVEEGGDCLVDTCLIEAAVDVAALGSLSGRLRLKAHTGKDLGLPVDAAGVVVTAKPVSGGAVFVSAPAAANGAFEILDLPAGDYVFTAAGGGYLLACQLVTIPAGEDIDIGLVSELMKVGELNADRAITPDDMTGVMAPAICTTTGEAGFNDQADVNRDGVINILDMVIVGENVGTDGTCVNP